MGLTAIQTVGLNGVEGASDLSIRQQVFLERTRRERVRTESPWIDETEG
jgi:hypothetical protein